MTTAKIYTINAKLSYIKKSFKGVDKKHLSFLLYNMISFNIVFILHWIIPDIEYIIITGRQTNKDL